MENKWNNKWYSYSKDINPSLGGYSSPSNLKVLGNELFFNANDGTNGGELWKTDGTTNGTVMVKDIFTGFGGSFPSGFTIFKNKLFFQADNNTNGIELWKIDGTANGTVLVSDIDTSGDSYPYGLIVLNDELFFSAYVNTIGEELWKYTPPSCPTIVTATIDTLISGTITLPSGTTVSTEGVYLDTLKNSDDCVTNITTYNISFVTGITEITSQNISVYPNLATSQLTIKIAANINVIKIIDFTGKTVKIIVQNVKTFDISDLTKGIYFLQIQTENAVLTTKFIKRDF